MPLGLAAMAAPPALAQVLLWDRGEWSEAGLPNPLPAGATVDAIDVSGAPVKSFSGVVESRGTVRWRSNNSIRFNSFGGGFVNGGLFDVQRDVALSPVSAATFDNVGTLRKSVGTGTLTINTSLINRTGATLDAQSGEMRYRGNSTFEDGTVFSGAGTHRFDGSMTFGASHVAPSGALQFASGTFSSATASTAALGSSATWIGGAFGGNWRVGSGVTLAADLGTAKRIFGRFENDGSLIWRSGDSLNLSVRDTLIVNRGLIETQSDTRFFPTQWATLDNSGVLRKSGGDGEWRLELKVINRSGGLLEATSGSIVYAVDGVFEDNSVFVGPGRHLLQGSFTAEGRLRADSGSLWLVSGQLASASGRQARLEGDVVWTGGELLGSWIQPTGFALRAGEGGTKRLSGRFVNEGRIDWQTAQTFLFQSNDSLFVNAGTFDLQHDAALQPVSTGTFENRGLFRKSVQGGESALAVAFINRSGAVINADTGVIRLRGGGTFEADSVLTGGGRIVVDGGAYEVGGRLLGTTNNLQFASGNLRSASGATATLDSGLLWTGGVFEGRWSSAEGREILATGSTVKSITGAFTNQGVIRWATPTAMLLNTFGGTFRNEGRFEWLADADIRPVSEANLVNTGLLRKAAGAGVSRVLTSLENTGVIEVISGTLRLPDNWRNDGTLRGTATLQSSRISNAGEVSPGSPEGASPIGRLAIAGGLTLLPGGHLTVDLGSLPMAASSKEVGSPVGGSLVSDLLAVSGSVVLGGTLQLVAMPGYVPAVGDTFSVMSFAAMTGSFGQVLLQGFDAGVGFDVMTTALGVDVRVSVVPEPAGYLLLLGGLAALWARGRANGLRHFGHSPSARTGR